MFVSCVYLSTRLANIQSEQCNRFEKLETPDDDLFISNDNIAGHFRDSVPCTEEDQFQSEVEYICITTKRRFHKYTGRHGSGKMSHKSHELHRDLSYYQKYGKWIDLYFACYLCKAREGFVQCNATLWHAWGCQLVRWRLTFEEWHGRPHCHGAA